MRKTSLMAAIVAIVSLVILVQTSCQPAADTNRSVTLPNTNSAREAVDTSAIEAELLRIENDWPRVVKEKDVAAVGRVEADDVVLIYPDGSLGNKAQDLSDISNGNLTADAIEITDLKVKVLSADAAIVTGQTEFKNGKYKTPDGKFIDTTGKYRFIDTFARRNGDWKLVAGISTKITTPASTAAPAASASPTMKASPTAPPVTRTTPAMRPSPAAAASPAARTTP